MGVLTGSASIAGIVGLSRSIATLGQSQANAARGLNVDPHVLTKWQFAAKTTGVAVDSTTASFSGLEQAVSKMLLYGDKSKGIFDMPTDQGGLGAGWETKYKTDEQKRCSQYPLRL
jgi:hypothetical protein